MRLRLKEILKQRNLEQKDLAVASGLSARAISDLCNNKGNRYNKDTLERIILVLDIKDANELFDLNNQSSD
ncbi:helix-turn-helix domain-containing protein [Bacillus subtilis]|uniref:helix-turn-helix domain-containing protein n=1 Tax=Bacillus subtilis TaxID=1423 RepID=UPI0011C7A68C|nr:helix-turn-helix transcriptional regulator [Bacillus subtilis]TXK63744.1 helix-turn-helix transcriptional regulator [Bacillus subtilis]HEQ3553604.1 helix-turn-helix transcriptional regulator [Enterococcus faecalis]